VNPQTSGVLWKAAVVAAIVIVTRWLLRAPRVESPPETVQNTQVYAVRSRVKIAGFSIAAVFVVISLAFHHELSDPSGLWLMAIPVGFILLGIWLATGSVITSDRGITKKTIWSSQTVEWEKISGVRYYERQKYIEVSGEGHKINIDLRFVALRNLLDEILRHAKVQLETK
jgi:uncharacterized membrane protein